VDEWVWGNECISNLTDFFLINWKPNWALLCGRCGISAVWRFPVICPVYCWRLPASTLHRYILTHTLFIENQAQLSSLEWLIINVRFTISIIVLPTVLFLALLQAASKTAGLFDSRNIHIRPLWDNVRIHDEMGLPMYVAWGAGHKSTVVDALVTEQESFSRPWVVPLCFLP
jgi:hypothetical protein